jgi:hypothetical protein
LSNITPQSFYQTLKKRRLRLDIFAQVTMDFFDWYVVSWVNYELVYGVLDELHNYGCSQPGMS